ncbi:uncharacterized protein LOC126682378 isoform X1 [Mercurialis annua]|uniref:uncharacterized protein LOC126682378 isoform X1 n=1 Tax=Mercurialis annua TaxID=3986 RepID=UPI002160928D|nr:uncharacterized protein LOC126682378 isoform X1 [Mercurialis annua]
MPAFTAIALDRLLEPGTSKSVDKSVPGSNFVSKPKLLPKSRPVPNSNLHRRNSIAGTERKVNRPQISPALYATPEATPLPDSPSSFPPSPYIINHKRRGPRLLKSNSEDDVACRRKNMDEVKINGNGENKVRHSTEDQCVTFAISDSVDKMQSNGVQDSSGKLKNPNGAVEAYRETQMNGIHGSEIGSTSGESKSKFIKNGLTVEKDVPKLIVLNSERVGESEESASYTSNTYVEENSAVESSAKLALTTPVGEFYDAWEELSSENELQSSFRDIEAELREMRLNLLMEIEKRKQAEGTLNNAQKQWQKMREKLALAGLTLPAFPFTVSECEDSLDADPAEELCQQVYLARFVSNSIGMGLAKAEADIEKEAEMEAKNFEIARLWDRLHYYEAMNREMSQRNQEAVEMGRRNRQVRKRRQGWVWGSIAAVLTFGTAALAWSYLPETKGSSSISEHNDGAK